MLNLQNTWFETDTLITECVDNHLDQIIDHPIGYRYYFYEITINQVNMFFLYNYFFYIHENNFNYSFNQIYNMM